jgi:HAD superfamily hydrolase (TIGR01509 family)
MTILRPRGIFFDLYGTLLVYGNMRAAWIAWEKEMHAILHRKGADWSRRETKKRMEAFFSMKSPALHANRLTVYERRIRTLATSAGLSLSALEIRRIATRTIAVWQKHIPPDPSAAQVVRELAGRGKILALVTNYDHPPHVHAMIRRMRITRHFRAVIVSGAVGLKKPDPGIFRLALRKCGLKAGEVVFVGDSQEDIRGALATGIRPVLIRRTRQATPFGGPVPAPRGAVRIRRLDELLTLLA